MRYDIIKEIITNIFLSFDKSYLKIKIVSCTFSFYTQTKLILHKYL